MLQGVPKPEQGREGPLRLRILDLARGLALVAMAIYHFTWDLEFFGYIAGGTANSGGWMVFARCIAASFLFLAGIGLALGHGNGIRWPSFWRRLAKIAGAAALISVATYFAMPDAFIFFGILHSIAAASLVGLLFLRLPVALTVAVAIAAIAAPQFLRAEIFNQPALWWVGLSSAPPRSNDYVPLLPWLGPFLLGLAIGRIAQARGFLAPLAGLNTGLSPKLHLLERAGRNSLVVYLLHQPILIALVYGASLVMPPDMTQDYVESCVSSCLLQESGVDCQSFCGCTLEKLQGLDLFDDLNAGRIDLQTDARVADIAMQCTRAAQVPAP